MRGRRTHLQGGHDTVVSAPGTLGRPLVPFGRALQEERGRQASEYCGMLRHEGSCHVHTAGQTHRNCRRDDVQRSPDGERVSLSGAARSWASSRRRDRPLAGPAKEGDGATGTRDGAAATIAELRPTPPPPPPPTGSAPSRTGARVAHALYTRARGNNVKLLLYYKCDCCAYTILRIINNDMVYTCIT